MTYEFINVHEAIHRQEREFRRQKKRASFQIREFIIEQKHLSAQRACPFDLEPFFETMPMKFMLTGKRLGLVGH